MTAPGDAPHVLVAGNATIDENFVGGVSTGPRLGGSGAIVSLALVRFGNRVTWLGHVGPDGGELLAPLAAAGVEMLPLRAAATLRFENRYPDPAHPERRVQRASRIPPPFTLAELTAAVGSRAFDFLVLGPLTPGEIPISLLDAVPGLHLPAAIDLQGYVRSVERDGSVLPAGWPAGRAFPAGFRVVHVDEAEARLMLAGLGGGLPDLARLLGAGLVSITRGGDGATLWSGGSEPRPPLPIAAIRPRAVRAEAPLGDTTGCGDVFLAGLVHGELRSWSRERSGRFAAAAAGVNASSFDLRIPGEAEVEELLSAGA